MKEKIARALCKQRGFDPDRKFNDGEPWWTVYLGQADAVMEAMREPGDKIAAQLLCSDKWQSMDGKNGREQFMDPFDAWREILRLAALTGDKQGRGDV